MTTTSSPTTRSPSGATPPPKRTHAISTRAASSSSRKATAAAVVALLSVSSGPSSSARAAAAAAPSSASSAAFVGSSIAHRGGGMARFAPPLRPSTSATTATTTKSTTPFLVFPPSTNGCGRPPLRSATLPSVAAESSSATSSAGEEQEEDEEERLVHDYEAYETIDAFNEALERLAVRCGDDGDNEDLDGDGGGGGGGGDGGGEDVIGLASLAEGMLRRLESDLNLPSTFEEEESDVVDGEVNVAKAAKEPACDKPHLIPNLATYNAVLKCWSRATVALASGRGRGTLANHIDGRAYVKHGVYSARDAANEAYNILKKMERRWLTTLQRKQEEKGGEGGDDEELPEQQHAVMPDRSSYDAVIYAFAKSDTGEEGAAVAEKLLRRMQELSSMSPSSVQPDASTYGAVMDAHTQSDTAEGLKSALRLFEEMESLYDDGGRVDDTIKPTVRMYDSLMAACARDAVKAVSSVYNPPPLTNADGGEQQSQQPKQQRGRRNVDRQRAWNAAKSAERLLRQCRQRYDETGDVDFRPDTTSYAAVIDAYGRIGDVAATEKAERLLLEEMEDHDYHYRPNTKTYTSVISAWSRTRTPDDRGPHRAEALLKRMEERGFEGDDDRVKPTVRTYTAVINCWARSNDPTKAGRSLRILKHMGTLAKELNDESLKPNLYTYNSAIDACAKTRGTAEQQAQALKIAFAINKAIVARPDVEGNEITYATLLNAAANLLPSGKERNDISRAVFERCQREGYVDYNVVERMQRATDQGLYRELLGECLDDNGSYRRDRIPREWCKNASR